MKGVIPTEETLRKRRQSQTIAQNKPGTKAKRALTNAKPEVRERRSQSQKIAMNKLETKVKRAETNARLEVKEKRSNAAKIAWAKPDVREKRSNAAKIVGARPEEKARRSKRLKDEWQNPEKRQKRIESIKIACNLPDKKAAKSKLVEKLWQTEDFVKKQMKANHVKQNKMEKKVENTIYEILPNEYKFVGHGEVVIAGKCPDFININNQKKIIELYGDYWHEGQDPQDRIDIFAKYGYDTLIIWEHELKDIEILKKKINEFHIKINPYSIHMEK